MSESPKNTTEAQPRIGLLEDVASDVRMQLIARLATSEGSADDVIKELAGALGKQIEFKTAELQEEEASESVVVEVAEDSESVIEDPRLTVYHQQYESLSTDVKERMTFRAVAQKLLANDGEKLKLAENMQGGGHLFDINENGEVLIKDKGLEPVMYGFDNRNELIQIYDRKPEDMERVKKWANYHDVRKQVLEDGYEMFKDDGEYGFSDDMKHASVVNEDELFVASTDKDEWRVSWLESGKNPAGARVAGFVPVDGFVYVYEFNAGDRGGSFGVVRLLRV